MSKVLWRYSDGTEFRSYDRTCDEFGNRLDGKQRKPVSPIQKRTVLHPGSSAYQDAKTLFGVPSKTGTLRTILAATEANRTRTARRDVMRTARRITTETLQNRRNETAVFATKSPLECLREDVANGLLPRSDVWVAETFQVDKGDRHYLTFTLEAMGYLVQLERLTGDYSSQRRIVEASMRHTPSGKGQNLRVSKAWKRSRWTSTVYLTAEDLQRAESVASGPVEVMSETQRGITCIRYGTSRGWKVRAIVQRHLREATRATT